eukprot:TRINITY_DN2425_c0_g2_i1.p1 TRINITY_DN2425_c0_g2~~TRINITY_DN2425_c0_g2_i1.p1  ORF type:complete len:409 (+),score=98.88 TRINITY_DN2425_c0_g2_i1:116-1342(+)
MAVALTPSKGKNQAAGDVAAEPRLPSLVEGGPDPDGLLEYSVVYTNRSLNHMSKKFQQVMRDISEKLKTIYHADAAVLVPGGGSYAMESVARQLGHNKKCLVLRNGYFSYRWTQIFEMGGIPNTEIVLKARPVEAGSKKPVYAPCPLNEVIAAIQEEKPDIVFAPHVETSSGMILPEHYMKAVAGAAHAVGALVVLDCIASGAVWVDMASVGVDVLISAPQKTWSGSPACGIVMLSQRGSAAVEASTSTSFCMDLKKWASVMKAYEGGGHMYHATMPTDAISKLRDCIDEVVTIGPERLREAQWRLGANVRAALARRGLKSVAADGFAAPGVPVFYTDDPDVKNGSKFAAQGYQIAAGVPLMVDEFTKSAAFMTFRLGLFGMDKLSKCDHTVRLLEIALDRIFPAARL